MAEHEHDPDASKYNQRISWATEQYSRPALNISSFIGKVHENGNVPVYSFRHRSDMFPKPEGLTAKVKTQVRKLHIVLLSEIGLSLLEEGKRICKEYDYDYRLFLKACDKHMEELQKKDNTETGDDLL